MLIKKEGLWIIAVAALVSLVINEIYAIGNYSIWDDVIVSANRNQNGVITLGFVVLMFVLGLMIIRGKSVRWQHE